MSKIVTTEQQLAEAFTAWHKMAADAPDAYADRDTPEETGEACAAYLVKLLRAPSPNHPSH